MSFQRIAGCFSACFAGCFLLFARTTPILAEDAKPLLSADEIREGWILLFDGESAFGWAGKPTIKDGIISSPTDELVHSIQLPPGTILTQGTSKNSRSPQPRTEPFATIKHTGGTNLVAFKPSNSVPLFNGKDLAGWKLYKGEPKRELSQFTVTANGELSLKNGPGDLQTEKMFDDFCLQCECKTNGTALNSGVFFRCVPNQYQAGYEAQIQNAYSGGDRTKPTDFGTGAIYRRIAARKVVSNDNEWFTMTVIAHGDRIATWVNGYPVVSWKDERPASENARQGKKLGAGHISIQGHDPTTDLLFRNIRIATYK